MRVSIDNVMICAYLCFINHEKIDTMKTYIASTKTLTEALDLFDRAEEEIDYELTEQAAKYTAANYAKNGYTITRIESLNGGDFSIIGRRPYLVIPGAEEHKETEAVYFMEGNTVFTANSDLNDKRFDRDSIRIIEKF